MLISIIVRPIFFHIGEDITVFKQTALELEQKKKDLENIAERCAIFQRFFDNAPVMMGMS